MHGPAGPETSFTERRRTAHHAQYRQIAARRRRVSRVAFFSTPVALMLLFVLTSSASGADLTDLSRQAPVRVSASTAPVELGVSFTPTTKAVVTSLRFPRPKAFTGPHTASLWTSRGTLLATATTVRGDSGGHLQTAVFTIPVPVTPGQLYVASYFAPGGRYYYRPGAYMRPTLQGTLRIPAGGGRRDADAGFPGTTGEETGFLIRLVAKVSGGPTTPTSTGTAVPTPTGSPTPTPTATATATRTPTAPATTAPIPRRNCLADPSACGYPDAGTTGYRHTGVTLTPYTGPMTVTDAGTVIDGKLIKGQLIIRADNVTVRRSKLLYPHADCDGLCGGISILAGRHSLIEDVEVDGNGGVCYAGVELGDGGSTARRVDSHDCGDGFRVGTGSVIEDSYVHDVWRGTLDGKLADTPHNDGIQGIGDSHMTFRHNTIMVVPYDSPYANTGVNSAIQMGGEFGTPTDVTIADNLFDGGGYTLREDENGSGFVISGNRFGRRSQYGIFNSNGGEYVWKGNVWDDTGAPAKD